MFLFHGRDVGCGGADTHRRGVVEQNVEIHEGGGLVFGRGSAGDRDGVPAEDAHEGGGHGGAEGDQRIHLVGGLGDVDAKIDMNLGQLAGHLRCKNAAGVVLAEGDRAVATHFHRGGDGAGFFRDRADGGGIGGGEKRRPQAQRVGEIYRHAGRAGKRHHQQRRHDAEIARAVRYETGRKDRHAMSSTLKLFCFYIQSIKYGKIDMVYEGLTADRA